MAGGSFRFASLWATGTPVLVLHVGGEDQDHLQRSHRVHQDVPPAPVDPARVVPGAPGWFRCSSLTGYHAQKWVAAVARAKDSPQVQDFLT